MSRTLWYDFQLPSSSGEANVTQLSVPNANLGKDTVRVSSQTYAVED